MSDLRPLLPSPPRFIDSRWKPILDGLRRQRLATGFAALLLLGAMVYLVTRPPQMQWGQPQMEASPALLLALIPTYAIMFAIVEIPRRRILWLIQNGEERPGTIVHESSLFSFRDLTIAFEHEQAAHLATFRAPARLRYEELDYEGMRLIRMLVHPKRPKWLQPIPRLVD